MKFHVGNLYLYSGLLAYIEHLTFTFGHSL